MLEEPMLKEESHVKGNFLGFEFFFIMSQRKIHLSVDEKDFGIKICIIDILNHTGNFRIVIYIYKNVEKT